jgi:hypothetical protein
MSSPTVSPTATFPHESHGSNRRQLLFVCVEQHTAGYGTGQANGHSRAQRTPFRAIFCCPARQKSQGRTYRSRPASFFNTASPNLGLPTPDFALRVREIQVEGAHKVGSHTLFIARIVHDDRWAHGPEMFVVHGIYQAARHRSHAELASESLATWALHISVARLFRKVLLSALSPPNNRKSRPNVECGSSAAAFPKRSTLSNSRLATNLDAASSWVSR